MKKIMLILALFACVPQVNAGAKSRWHDIKVVRGTKNGPFFPPRNPSSKTSVTTTRPNERCKVLTGVLGIFAATAYVTCFIATKIQ